MTKKKTSTPPNPGAPANDSAPKNNVIDLPLINKPEAAPEKPSVRIGVFNPNMMELPTHEQLLGILLVLGLQTRPFYGQDQQGNLVDQSGNPVIPKQLRNFFQLLQVEVPEAASA